MKAKDIKEVSEIILYYGGTKEERVIVAAYINIDKPLLGSTQKYYIIKEFCNNGGFWILVNEKKMEKKMENCICIKKACYKINIIQMKSIAAKFKDTHKMVELHLFE